MKSRLHRILMLGSVLLLGGTYAHATWSIAAVDPETGQVGAAAASCTFNVNGIASAVPGKGVVVVQAMSSGEAHEHGVVKMVEGATPAEIVEAMRAPEFDPENQQYAVIGLDPAHPPATYSGKEISGWRGAATGKGVSVQGNILAGEAVVTAALEAYEAAKGKPLADRLMRALSAGSEAGGDRRCGEQAATSAFLMVAKPGDPSTGRVFLRLVVFGVDEGSDPAVEILAEEYERWRGLKTSHTSTRWHIEP